MAIHTKGLSSGAKERGPCPVCNQGFRPATDKEWKQRWSYHLLLSERHKKYLALQNNSPYAINVFEEIAEFLN
jgi:hypothetical protein